MRPIKESRPLGWSLNTNQCILYLFFLLAVHLTWAQGNRIFKAADREYALLHYKDASTLYMAGLKKSPDNVPGLKHLADCYYQMNDYVKAEATYEHLVANIEKDVLDDKDILQYAEVLANNGNYNASKVWYEKYLVRKSSDSRGKTFPEAYSDVSRITLNKSGWELEFLSINSDRAEFSPTFYKDGLLFVSNRDRGILNKRIFGWNNTPFTEMYYVDRSDIRAIDLDSLKKQPEYQSSLKKGFFNDDNTKQTSNDSKTLQFAPDYLDDPLGRLLSSKTKATRLKGKINSKYHDGPAAVLNDSTLIFTRNNFHKGKYGKSKDGTNKLKLFISRKNKKNKWKGIEELPFNNDQYSVGHPGLSPDGNTLFFASDQPGGYGGSDIYKVERTADGSWGMPQNMGEQVNTEGDELFPYVDQNNNLIFASSGLPGFGGLDLFRIALNTNMETVSGAENMGPPINSPKDDFGLILNKDGLSGYFSSNRRGNDDIYSVFKDKIDLIATILYRNDNSPVNEAEVVLVAGDNEFGKLTGNDGTTHFLLEKEQDYTLMAIKNGYNKVKGTLTTKGSKGGESREMTLYLDACLKEYLVRAVYFDYDKYDIRADGREVLNEVTNMLEENPELNIEISAHTDQRASKTYNIRLSKNRANATKQYLADQGIDTSRMKLTYHGESILTNHCADGTKCNELEQQMNRRSEIQIIRDGVNLSSECAQTENVAVVEGVKFFIEGVVKDEATDRPVPNTMVTLNNGNRIDKLTDEKGQFIFPLSPNTDYEFIFSRENYVTQRFYITTKGLVRDHTFDYVIKLKEVVLDKRFSKNQ